jgi:hypothetical protein
LNTAFSRVVRRWTRKTTAEPTSHPSRMSTGEAKNSPETTTNSLRETDRA